MTETPLPPSYEWGFVVAHAMHATAAAIDSASRLPIARGSVGRVKFTPLVRSKVADTIPASFVQHEIVDVEMRNGQIVDKQLEPGVWMITGWYRVAFQIEGGAIEPFDFELTADHTEENPCVLAEVSPVVAPPGFVEVVTHETRIAAQQAAAAAELSATSAGESAALAETSKNNAQTAATTASNAAEQTVSVPIDPKPASDAPNTYPDGISVMGITTEPGWPFTFGVAVTYRFGNNRSYQHYVQRTGPARLWQRTPDAGDTGWLEWFELGKQGEPGVGSEWTLWSGTQAQYDAIGTKDPNTIYAVI